LRSSAGKEKWLHSLSGLAAFPFENPMMILGNNVMAHYALKGHQDVSPGQCPGKKSASYNCALKGQKNIFIRVNLLPFQGVFLFSHKYPGRCPGL
jgi:hypothetical protein